MGLACGSLVAAGPALEARLRDRPDDSDALHLLGALAFESARSARARGDLASALEAWSTVTRSWVPLLVDGPGWQGWVDARADVYARPVAADKRADARAAITSRLHAEAQALDGALERSGHVEEAPVTTALRLELAGARALYDIGGLTVGPVDGLILGPAGVVQHGLGEMEWKNQEMLRRAEISLLNAKADRAELTRTASATKRRKGRLPDIDKAFDIAGHILDRVDQMANRPAKSEGKQEPADSGAEGKAGEDAQPSAGPTSAKGPGSGSG